MAPAHDPRENPWADTLDLSIQALSTDDADPLDARSAWADAPRHTGHSRAGTHDLAPSRPSTPAPQSSVSFPSFAAIARSLSIPRSRTRPLSMDAADSTQQPHSAPTTRSATPPSATPQFDFQSFLDQMKSRAAEPVAKYLRSQVLPSRPPAALTIFQVPQQFHKENVHRKRPSQGHQRFLECTTSRLRY
jgi:hypothetical protein